MSDDPLLNVALDYVHQIDMLEFELKMMTGLMIFWMLIAIVEHIIIKVYKKGEK